MIKVPQIAMDILEVESGWFGGVVPSGILGMEWTDVGTSRVCIVRDGHSAKYKITSFVALLLFVAATPA